MNVSVRPRGPLARAILAVGLAVMMVPLGVSPVRAAPPGQTDPNVVVEITSPQPGQRLQGRVEIVGHASDRRATSGTGIDERDVRIYLQDAGDDRNLLRYAQSQRGSTVATALDLPRGQAEFSESWDTCAFAPGPYKLLVVASSQTVPGTRNVGSVDVTIEPCPPGQVLVQDDLAGAPAGTIRLENAGARGAWLGPQVVGDFAVGIDARCAQPDTDCGYALNFRRQVGPGNAPVVGHYALYVNPIEGALTLNYWPTGAGPGGATVLVPASRTPAIRRGAAVNRLAAVAEGDRLRVFVNGQQVGDLRDPQRAFGTIQWTAETRATDTVVAVQFANYVLATPGPIEALAPVLVSRESPALGPLGAPAPLAPLAGVTARPDLMLSARDLPPGFEEIVESVDYQGNALEVRRLERRGAEGAPAVIVNTTLQGSGPLAIEDVRTATRGYIASLTRSMASANVHLSDWDELDPAGLGEHAMMYGFRFSLMDRDGGGNGAVTVFARGEFMSILMIISADGRAVLDLRQYARVVDSRLTREVAGSR